MKKLCAFLALIIFLCSLSFAQSSGNPPAGQSSKAEAASRTVYTAPYSQNFGGAWLPADWTAENYWSQYNSNWARCWFDLGNVTETTGLYSPLINIPGYMYRLNFRWSHWLNPTYTNDIARVKVWSGGNWETVWQRLQTDFNSNDGASVNAPGSGVLESIDLTRFSGHVIQIMFEGFSGGGASWFIDDFNISYLDTGINSYPNVQDFSSATFPPPYWRNPNFSPYWTRSGINAYGASGQGSAIDSDNWDTGSTTVLESPFLNLGVYGGTLSFDHAYAHYAPLEPAHKDLQILVSYNGGQSFSVLQTFSGETGGSLVTALPVSGVFNPSGSQWATKTLQIPPGVNLLRFQSLNQYGSGYLFLDNLKFEKRNFPAGSGTAGDPYQIFSASQLSNVRLYQGSTFANTHFKLMADLDLLSFLAPTGEGGAVWGENRWLPIGNTGSPFYGSFDGNNHTISNLKSIYYGPNHGLFGVTAIGSTIKNLNLASTCAILGDTETGSIAGKNNGIIRNCSSAATVNIGNADKGGGISGNNTGSIFNSRFTGSVSRSAAAVNSHRLGGIAGNNETGAVIDSCFANASIAGGSWNGGLVGWNDGTVLRSHSSGTVSCYNNSQGGLVGQNNGNINNSYSRSNVSGASYVGGLVGNNGGSVTNCYSTGIPSASGPRGGLSGYGNTGITGCYWDIQTSGIASSFGGTGKTTAEMKLLSTYVMWDFAGETANGISNFWNMSLTDNSGYPFLTFELAPELRPALPLAPAHLSTGLPQSGFELSWAQGSQAVLPVSYNIILRKGYGDPGNYDLYSEIHTFPGILGTTFNPVSQGGFSFDYSNNTAYWWGWNVQSVGADGSTAMSQMFVFWIENDPALVISPGSP
ncbi:MAG TPA: GLUG motif-containing protein, partial [Candidatus Cloacimonadota bacterium]|nr:GLUG motif-containing protein [Candidatus Cloacimonadota bacterium]